jgi:hypothetical protein
MVRVSRSIIAAAVVLFVFWLLWSRLHIVIWVNASFWQILLVFAVLAIALFLGIDHLLNRTR